MFPIIDDVCQKMIEYVEKNIAKFGDQFDAKDLSSRYTIDVVSNCIYGVDSKSFTGDHSEIRQMGLALLQPSATLLVYFTAITVFPFIQYFYKMPFVSKKIEFFFTNLTRDAVE